MKDNINVMIVEDEAILAMDLEEKLLLEGFTIAGVADNADEALSIFKNNAVDLLLMDVSIKGDCDGIETIKRILSMREVPFIYLTAFTDAATIERAKETFPSAYLVKPFQIANLRIAIEMALNNFAVRKEVDSTPVFTLQGKEKEQSGKESILHFNGHVFIKQNYRFLKIKLEDIYYLEAENNYTNIYTVDKQYSLRLSLNAILEKLEMPGLIRVHRSYAVNLDHLTTFNDVFLNIGKNEVPLGRNYKDEFFKCFDFR
ncbi:LytR/AlgR family response regulator transcription factor [Solitalea canadensis]|uniref:Response regulator of the LytR/AlgR family n=1 Tax=Solitalea canadensis (strain ATCC 29591 / DSM 3403 / JCM 21819 / LMG 8368 / NBRC 15130 / NCIMB 12057 / USAM 9D) TaxID=929556 RepID=H8KSE1_SOLCM|nr:LytTR family transcriptional regulator DNA-binding domain-containing protein [Solitalea canadensis]AFD08049.1 response regulator of the LytR/AlgR family [Solitalea canadensis DSM 3403]